MSRFSFTVLICVAHCYGCTRDLGMESRFIKDGQITASSKSSDHFKPSLARLNEKTLGGGWCADINDPSPYLEIDLLTPHTVTRIDTQGANSNKIEKYSLSFSYDSKEWFNYTVNGKLQEFKGNGRNYFWTATNNLTVPLTARAFRIHPIIVTTVVSPCGRVELFGCQPFEDCNTPVGVEDGRITNQQMMASSQFNEHYAYCGRLNNQAGYDEKGKPHWGGWCTDKNDKNQYLQIDLGRVRSVSGVATQGYMPGMYVSQYKLNYSTDGLTWQAYRENGPDSGTKIFQGNWDNDNITRKVFPRRIFARFIRFNPIKFAAGGYICMRVEVYECLPTQGRVPRVSPPSGTVELNRTSSVNLTCIVTGQAGVRIEWYKNGGRIPPRAQIPPISCGNGSVKSVLTLKQVKYRDRGSIMSCSAWYPTLAINSTRNIFLLVHAPRPVITASDVQSRQIQLHVTDPTPRDTAKYIVRYKTNTGHSSWVTEMRNKTSQTGDVSITLHGVLPFTSYTVEVASYYKDGDVGPYSVNKHFKTKQAAPSGPPRDILVIPRGKSTIRVSWSIPSAKDINGIITKYEIVLYKRNGVTRTYLTGEKTLSKEINGLEANQRFYLGVRAYTKVGPGLYSRNHSYSTGNDQIFNNGFSS